jgi:hypothetical protein
VAPLLFENRLDPHWHQQRAAMNQLRPNHCIQGRQQEHDAKWDIEGIAEEEANPQVSLQRVFHWLESWPISAGVRESPWMFPAIESVHVIAITLVVGSILIVDLRVLGLTSRNERVTEIAGSILPWTWGVFCVAVVSGFTLFAAKAHTYFDNINFQTKMVLMAAAFINMLVFHLIPFRSVGTWDIGRPAPWPAKLTCAVSLTLWILIVAMGRWIGFSIEG